MIEYFARRGGLPKFPKIYASRGCPGSKSSCESLAHFFTTKRNQLFPMIEAEL